MNMIRKIAKRLLQPGVTLLLLFLIVNQPYYRPKLNQSYFALPFSVVFAFLFGLLDADWSIRILSDFSFLLGYFASVWASENTAEIVDGMVVGNFSLQYFCATIVIVNLLLLLYVAITYFINKKKRKTYETK